MPRDSGRRQGLDVESYRKGPGAGEEAEGAGRGPTSPGLGLRGAPVIPSRGKVLKGLRRGRAGKPVCDLVVPRSGVGPRAASPPPREVLEVSRRRISC